MDQTQHDRRIYIQVATSPVPCTHTSERDIFAPLAIQWPDGRHYKVERLLDFRPKGMTGTDLPADCYTVVIKGQVREIFQDDDGKWFVDVTDRS